MSTRTTTPDAYWTTADDSPIARRLLGTLLTTRADWSSVVLRLTLAVVMFPHGAQKLLGWFGGGGPAATISGFEAGFGIAAPLAVLVIIAEFFGPIALLAGLFTRLTGATFIVLMIVASRFHLANGFFMNWYGNQAGEGFEYHILATGVAVALVAAGAGRWSLDRRIASSLRASH